VTDRSVDVQIVGLRKKLGDCGGYIETVRGIGYRFKE
jgi:two-component system phosphate regulon response regulator PhoB